MESVDEHKPIKIISQGDSCPAVALCYLATGVIVLIDNNKAVMLPDERTAWMYAVRQMRKRGL